MDPFYLAVLVSQQEQQQGSGSGSAKLCADIY